MLAQAIVMAVAVAQGLSRRQVEKAGLGIEIGRVGVDGQDLGDEHVVAAQLAHSRTRHSRLTGDSPMSGARMCFAGSGVSFISLNLSKSRPLFTPHQSTARAMAAVVRLMANSPLLRIISYEKRSGRTEMEHMGGSRQTIPVQATVMTLRARRDRRN